MPVFLVMLSGVPLFIGLFQSFNNGGLGWPMMWLNEQLFWSVVFSSLAFYGIWLSYRARSKKPIAFVFTVVLALILIFPTAHDVIKVGFGPSSKGDAEQLEIMGFWGSHWWL